MSPTCFGAHCAVIREKSYHFSKPSAYCNVVTLDVKRVILYFDRCNMAILAYRLVVFSGLSKGPQQLEQKRNIYDHSTMK